MDFEKKEKKTGVLKNTFRILLYCANDDNESNDKQGACDGKSNDFCFYR